MSQIGLVVASIVGALGPFVAVALVVLAARKVRALRRRAGDGDQGEVGSSSA